MYAYLTYVAYKCNDFLRYTMKSRGILELKYQKELSAETFLSDC